MTQQTLEEAAQKLYPIEYTGRMFMPSRDELNNSYKQEAFIEGANWMEKRMYSEKEVLQLLLRLQQTESYDNLYNWFEQNKKK
jgi:hypothetical protein